MINIQVHGCNFNAKIIKDYDAFELVLIDIDLGPGRHSAVYFTYSELEAYREAYDQDIE